MSARHRFVKSAKDKHPSVVTGIVEAVETFILKFAKGCRKITGRRRESAAAKPKSAAFQLSTDDHDATLIIRDRPGTTTDHDLLDFEGRTFQAFLVASL